MDAQHRMDYEFYRLQQRKARASRRFGAMNGKKPRPKPLPALRLPPALAARLAALWDGE